MRRILHSIIEFINPNGWEAIQERKNETEYRLGSLSITLVGYIRTERHINTGRVRTMTTEVNPNKWRVLNH